MGPVVIVGQVLSAHRSADPGAVLLDERVLLSAGAGLSAGVTTAMTYALRVGTSICDRALRASSSASAISRLGANAARMSRTLEGRWVNTIVFSRPMRRAIAGAASCEAALSSPAAKKNVP